MIRDEELELIGSFTLHFILCKELFVFWIFTSQ